MPERSFGRTIRSRRTQLGLSQAKLGELVGRSPTAVRAWERDKSHPTDTAVITALSAVLGVDERTLFDRIDLEPPAVETSPTIEQALASLAPGPAADVEPPQREAAEKAEPSLEPSYILPAEAYVLTAETPAVVVDRSYMEDSSQRQLYRVRTLATIVALVALGVALLWAAGEGLGALGDWWDDFFGNLRL